MTQEQIFSMANAIALAGWALLVLLPGRAGIAKVVSGFAVPALLAAAYVPLVLTHWSGAAGGFSSLADVAQLFANRWLLLGGWLHYLCFDLLIGCWEVTDARERGIPHLVVVPCLLLTFMFGPTGWLLYRGLRVAFARRTIAAGRP